MCLHSRQSLVAVHLLAKLFQLAVKTLCWRAPLGFAVCLPLSVVLIHSHSLIATAEWNRRIRSISKLNTTKIVIFGGMWWSLLFSISLSLTLKTPLCLTSCLQPPRRVTFREESMPERQRWAKHCGKRVERSNESPPDGSLPGIATHLWLLYSRFRGNSSAWWKPTILLLRRISVDFFVCLFVFVGFFCADLNGKIQTTCSQHWHWRAELFNQLCFGFFELNRLKHILFICSFLFILFIIFQDWGSRVNIMFKTTK